MRRDAGPGDMQERWRRHPSRKGEAEQVLTDRQTPQDNDAELCSRLCPLACGPTKKWLWAVLNDPEQGLYAAGTQTAEP